ncbi:hypothetical protein K437DRAFT_262388 [Tilletiaria anomala UBC 951]|uniref:Uncharacterized protein n=1 Tax=Tilletiaria anomala (strain ATCC 24038 / CBS 436.72 / UBC 951) TaxID=1037660 RepID=A0A066WAD8_TILAU|nr:uncharacterized protein K437DRAFT_262388 [Tilletiaria anomala UBC 951]KDN47740.1 hypothetical protein K437DRAFT_262388 [Tilletiaria anomala UBC 951]
MDERLSAAATSIIKQKIEPSPHTINLPLGLPASSLSSCVLAALKTGDAATQVASASSKGLGGVDKKETSAARNSLMAKEKYVEAQQAYLCARHMCEWYLAAYSGWSSSPYTLPSTQETKERLTSSYTKLLDLYTLQVLGPKFAEWDYAREMLAYSSLTQDVKEKLLVKLDSVQEHHEHRAERTRVASGDLKARIEKEKERRAEMAVKEAAAATSSKRASAQGANSVAGEKSSRLRSQSSGGSSPPAELRRRRSDDTPGAYGDGAHKPTSMSSSAASSTASLLRNNTSGDRKSDAPAFGISSAASLPPPATSSSLADKGTDGGKRDKWRAGSASSSASTNGSGSERETAGERGTKQGQGELHRTDTNEASFVATRAHIANTIERHRSRDLSSTSFSSPRGVSRRPETNPGNSPAGLTGYLAQARAYVLQLPSTSGVVLSYASIGIVLMFVLRRALARGSKTLANRRTEIHPARASASFSAAAQEARRKLAKRRQEESGFAKWVLGIWWRALGKIWQTIRM